LGRCTCGLRSSLRDRKGDRGRLLGALSDSTFALFRGRERCQRRSWRGARPKACFVTRRVPSNVARGDGDGVIGREKGRKSSRRYFFKAMSSEPERAREALAMIGQLFRIERDLADKTAKQRKRDRQKKSKPVVEAFFRWCEIQAETALDDTPLAKALGDAYNQREAYKRFLDDDLLPLHNNNSELQLRREAVGRKN